MIKAVIFDLDGTLINSLDDLANSVNHTLIEFGFPTHETEKYKYFIGRGMANLIYNALPENKRDSDTQKSVLDTFMAYYKLHSTDNTAPYGDIPELLDTLERMGIKTAVVTNKAHAAAEKIVKQLLLDRFDICFGQRPDIPTKPDPTLTLMAIKELCCEPCDCLYVGDSGGDMVTAVNSGTVPVGVLWGFREKKELIDNGAKHIISTPMELIEVIKQYT